MKKRIFASFISLAALLVLSIPLSAQTQKQIKQPLKVFKENIPLYNGTFVGVDLFGIGSKAFGGNSISSEVSVDVSLKNRFFPIAEVGFGKTDMDKNGISYQSSAPYFRLGMNYNLMYKKNNLSHIYIGARYGFSSLSYDVKGPALTDDIYPTSNNTPFVYNGEKTNAHWMELLFGIRAQVHKNFLMGWSLRYKARISVKENEHSTPEYIPGFGNNKSTNFGATYSLIYKLPF